MCKRALTRAHPICGSSTEKRRRCRMSKGIEGSTKSIHLTDVVKTQESSTKDVPPIRILPVDPPAGEAMAQKLSTVHCMAWYSPGPHIRYNITRTFSAWNRYFSGVNTRCNFTRNVWHFARREALLTEFHVPGFTISSTILREAATQWLRFCQINSFQLLALRVILRAAALGGHTVQLAACA